MLDSFPMRLTLICFLFAYVTSLSAALAAPSVLGRGDRGTYEKIFEIQEKGDWRAADALIGKLKDDVLLGYVLYQRYMHPTAYRSSYRELSRWLTAYADHPDARAIYRLAQSRRGNAAAPRRHQARRWRPTATQPLHPTLIADYTRNGGANVRRIERELRRLTRTNRPDQALRYLNAPAQFNALTAAQTDRARGWIAASFYYDGQLTKAKQLANLAAGRSSDSAVLAHWISGLIAWRQGALDAAYSHFSAQADNRFQTDALRAGAAFWAARGALGTGDSENLVRYLQIAADFPFTFYGQLALAQLGSDPAISWEIKPLSRKAFRELAEDHPRLRRAVALAEIGLTREAQTELIWLQGEVSPELDPALLSVARDLSLPHAELIMGTYAGDEGAAGPAALAARYPLPAFSPTGGFQVDRAVLFGLIRQESKFLPQARSGAGARGLMQLMPRTASYVADGEDIGHTHASSRLYDPAYNMQLGQSYVDQLLTRYNGGRGDLIEMALSYNWGPGNFQRWRARTPIEDQLLMLESVPNSEARHFVDVVLTNIWVYRDRLGEPAPSRDALAAGDRPVYRSVEVSPQ